MTTPLVPLQQHRTEIVQTGGMFSADNLTDACANAADVIRPGGNPDTLIHMAWDYGTASRRIDEARLAIDKFRQRLPEIWVGEAATSADAALKALSRALERGEHAMDKFNDVLSRLAAQIDWARGRDEKGAAELRTARARADDLEWGILPDPLDFDRAGLARVREQALDGVDGRISAHETVRDAAREAKREFNELSGQARLSKLADSPMSALDELLIVDAGSTAQNLDEAILTAHQADRAAESLSRLNDADRARVQQMLDSARSPEHKAFLMKALAAGYSVNEIDTFNKTVSPFAHDPAWLRAHLSPLDQTGADPAGRQTSTTFNGTQWTQGQNPTCNALSTVTSRAQVDPLYALQLTTGGHPGDPAFDNGTAFSQRLHDEMYRVYDEGRHALPVPNQPAGMYGDQAVHIATQEIGTRTGQQYDIVNVNTPDERREMLERVERAVDRGQPVPFGVGDSSGGHQMIVVGHENGMLQIYNPWGYTVWVSEEDFVNGTMDKAGQGVPKNVISVLVPKDK